MITQHELVGEHGCSCGLVENDFNALIIHLIRCNGGEFIVSDTCGRGRSGDDGPVAPGALRKPDITELS